MKKRILKKGLLIGVILLFFGASVLPIISGKEKNIPFPMDLNDGLVGYWSFDFETAEDESDNNNHGTIHGAVAVDGISGKALGFGGNDGVRINDDSSLDGFSKLTILAWAKPHNHEGGNMGYVVGKYEEHYAVRCPYRIWAYEGDWIAELGDGSDYYIARSPIIMDEQWHHLVLWWDGTELKLFVNGDETDSAPANTFLYNNNEYLRFGERVDDGFFDGIIDEVRIYDRALDEYEIQELYNNPGNLHKTFIVGRIGELNKDTGNLITFKAANIHCIKFNPFSYTKYYLGEQIKISEDYKGLITGKFIITSCNANI